MMQDVLIATTVLSLISTVGFVIVYAVRARGWWRDPLGRLLMLGGIAVATLSAVGTLRRVDTHYASVNLTDALTVGSSLAYLAVALTWAYKSRVILQETQERREGET